MTKGKILAVDDEPANLALLEGILAPTYPLVFARNGADALACARKHQPALILLDIQMPGMDGHEVCRRLKADPVLEAIPVIFVTALSDAGNEIEGFELGAVDYIIKPVIAPVVQARVRAQLSQVRACDLERSHRDCIAMLGTAGHYNDTDTGVHIWRMAGYARALATGLGYDPDDAELLEWAATMHDTGKIGLPDSILKKPASLSPDERELMKTHTTIGYQILNHSKAPLFQLAAEIALHHHERWDGGGYPHGLAGTAIPESARIVAIADVFDALLVRRPYKDAWPLPDTLSTMEQEKGRQFDPRLLDCFFDIMPQLLDIKAQWDARENAEAHRPDNA